MNQKKQMRFRTSARLGLEPLEGRLLPANLIPNGNFELGNFGFGTQHVYSPGDIFDPATYDVVTSPKLSHPAAASFGDHTTGSGLMMAVNGAVVADQIVWTRIVKVAPNSPYIFSAWVSNWDVNPSHPVAKLEFRLNNVLAGTFNAPSSAGVWARFSTGWYSGAANKLKITITNQDLAYTGNDFALDDISLIRNKPGLTGPDREASPDCPPLPIGECPPPLGASAVFSLVHEASGVAVVGPALTPGSRTPATAGTPFTGFLDVRLEPTNADDSSQTARSPVNGAEPNDASLPTRRQRRAYYREAERPVNGTLAEINGSILWSSKSIVSTADLR